MEYVVCRSVPWSRTSDPPLVSTPLLHRCLSANSLSSAQVRSGQVHSSLEATTAVAGAKCLLSYLEELRSLHFTSLHLTSHHFAAASDRKGAVIIGYCIITKSLKVVSGQFFHISPSFPCIRITLSYSY
jgi:hypothetical protein